MNRPPLPAECAADDIPISVLVPARSSGPTLLANTERLIAYFARTFGEGSFEIILIPNGANTAESSETWQAAQEARRLHPETIRVCGTQLATPGKGAALRAGFGLARGRWIFTVDSDLPYDLDFFSQASRLLENGVDYIQGNRRLPESRFTVPVRLLPLVYGRHRLGLLFNLLARTVFRLETRDTQAGIKALSREFAEVAFRHQTCPGFLFDLEHHLSARQNGFSVADLPVHFQLRDEKSTLRLAREAVLALWWITRIQARCLRGGYRVLSEVRRAYGAAPGITRAFVSLRSRQTPYLRLARVFNLPGTVVDLGAGHGLLALTLAGLGKRGRRVLGFDHDPARVASARRASEGVSGFGPVEFLEQRIEDLRFEKDSLAGISLLDVLHYLPTATQDAVLSHAFGSLQMGGTLLVREVAGAEIRSLITRIYENLAAAFGFTQTSDRRCFFREPRELADRLRHLGFEVSVAPSPGWFFSDVVFTAVKSPGEKRPSSHGLRVTADDWGLSPAVNRATLRLARQGAVHRVSVLVDSPFACVGWDELRQIPGLEIGLHFNLTQRFPGMPSTVALRRLLLRALAARLFGVGRSSLESWATREFDRQLTRLRDIGIPRPSHVDSHHHVHLFPIIADTLAPLLAQEGFREIRLVRRTGGSVGILARPRPDRFVLDLLSRASQPTYDRHGLKAPPVYYPLPSQLRSSSSSSSATAEWIVQAARLGPETEVILHPADPI